MSRDDWDDCWEIKWGEVLGESLRIISLSEIDETETVGGDAEDL